MSFRQGFVLHLLRVPPRLLHPDQPLTNPNATPFIDAVRFPLHCLKRAYPVLDIRVGSTGSTQGIVNASHQFTFTVTRIHTSTAQAEGVLKSSHIPNACEQGTTPQTRQAITSHSSGRLAGSLTIPALYIALTSRCSSMTSRIQVGVYSLHGTEGHT